MSQTEIPLLLKNADDFLIAGIKNSGDQFRPSDWSERLCGIMSSFRADKSKALDSHLRYSPFVSPCIWKGVKSVLVDGHLRQQFPLAYHFLVNFAKDNDLMVVAVDVPKSE
jgi:Protein of unknown function (DUF3579)